MGIGYGPLKSLLAPLLGGLCVLCATILFSLRERRRAAQMPKDSPQPQLFFSFGFWNLKPWLMSLTS